MSALPHEEPLDALRTLLRSFGQIVLQANALTGACVLAAWLVCDPRLACGALAGAIAANIGALLRGYDLREMRDGLHGFNGALAALAALSFIADTATAMAVAIIASTASAWLHGPWARVLRSQGLGVYSSPCLLVTWTWLLLVHPAAAPHAPAVELHPSWLELTHGVLAGIAQTSFAFNALAGALILGGIALASRRSAVYALAGAALATILQALVGNAASLDAGLYGFNGALAALALADCGLLAAAGGVLAAVLLQQVAALCAIPAMTAPFVIAAWTVRWLRVGMKSDMKRNMKHDMMRETGRFGAGSTASHTRETICRSLTRPRGASRNPG
jgi:urea transporter